MLRLILSTVVCNNIRLKFTTYLKFKIRKSNTAAYVPGTHSGLFYGLCAQYRYTGYSYSYSTVVVHAVAKVPPLGLTHM